MPNRPVHVDYVAELSTKFGYLPAWPPNYPLRLGDVVRVEDGVVSQVDTLASLGLEIQVRRGQRARFEHSSSDGVHLAMKGEGSADAGHIGALDAGTELQFERRHAIYFVADDAVVETVEGAHPSRA